MALLYQQARPALLVSTQASSVSALPARQPATSLPAAVNTRVVLVSKSRAKRRIVVQAAQVVDDLDRGPDPSRLREEPKPENFDWSAAWYPVALIETLEYNRPNKAQLMGRDLVLWFNMDATWSAFEDRCPHKQIPLSEGRLVTSKDDCQLVCPNHGWMFNAKGKPTVIPQLPRDQQAKAAAEPKACAVSYPTREAGGILWVWLQSGSGALKATRTRLTPMVPMLDFGAENRSLGNWVVRDLPYDWEYFLENVTDPAHGIVAQHGIVGDRNDPRPIKATVVEDVQPSGFKFERDPPSETAPSGWVSSTEFVAPSFVRLRLNYEDGAEISRLLYMSPLRPGTVRVFSRNYIQKPYERRARPPPGFHLFNKPTWLEYYRWAWLDHLLLQDLCGVEDPILYGQQQSVLLTGRQYHQPEGIDRSDSMFREWFESKAGGRVPYPPGARLEATSTSEADAEAVLGDRYNQHTRHCWACSTALTNTRAAKWVAAFAAAAAALRAVLLTISGTVSFASASASSGTQASIAALREVGFSTAGVVISHAAARWAAAAAGLLLLVAGLVRLEEAFLRRRLHRKWA